MNCPKCSSDSKVKAGFIDGKQRYKCRSCNYHFSVTLKSTAKPKSLKKQALQLYLEGLGFRSIGRLLGVSNVSVLNWIRSFGEEISTLQERDAPVEFVELDEMHSCIKNKKTTVGFGLLLIAIGKSSSTSLLATKAQCQPKKYGNQ